MKKIKQLSMAIMIFSLFGLPYYATSAFAQEGIVCGDGQFDVSLTCDPTSGTCCNQCDPGTACEANPHSIPCCENTTPDVNNDPSSTGSSDTVTFDSNTGLSSQVPRNNVTRSRNGTVRRGRPNTGLSLQVPRNNVTRSQSGTVTQRPSVSNRGTGTQNVQGIEDLSNRRPQSRTSTPIFVPPGGTQANTQDRYLNHRFNCEDVRAEISDKLYIVEDDLNNKLPGFIQQTGCDVSNGKSRGCLLLNLEAGPIGEVIYGSIEKIREILEYIRSRCLATGNK